MKHRRNSHQCEMWKDEMIVMGGNEAFRSVEILTISTRQWRTGPSLPSSFYWGQSLTYQETIFLVSHTGVVVKLSDDKWQEVASIGDIGTRPVYPAPRVTMAMVGC